MPAVTLPQGAAGPVSPPPTGWWLLWLVSTVVMPVVFMVLAFMEGGPLSTAGGNTFVVSSFVLHLLASIMLGVRRGGCIFALALFGGWVLILASMFSGCVVMYIQNQNKTPPSGVPTSFPGGLPSTPVPAPVTPPNPGNPPGR